MEKILSKNQLKSKKVDVDKMLYYIAQLTEKQPDMTAAQAAIKHSK